MRWFFGLPLVMFAAVVFVVASPAAAEVVSVDLGIDAPSGVNNTLTMKVTIDADLISEKDDSDTATISGNMLTKLQAEFDPTTQELTSLTGIEFYGGSFTCTSIALDYDYGWLIGELHASGVGIGGTFDTIPTPFGSVTGNNTFNSAEHEAILDQGTLTVTGTGLLSDANMTVNLATDPVSGTTEGSGSVSVSLATLIGNMATYNVNVVMPLDINQHLPGPGDDALPMNAEVDIEASGTYVASGSFTRTIPVNPIAVDDPMSGNESYYNVLEDNQLTIAAGQGVLVNDSDPNGDALSAIKVSNPDHGSVTLNSNGSLVYTPDDNWHGTDSFTYKANDGANDSNVATVDVVVDSVLDVPDVTLGLIDNGAVGSGLHSYTLTATGIGITSLSEFTIDGEVHQVFNGGEQTEWLGDGSAIDTEVTDSYVIFGDERIPDQGLTPVVITEETIIGGGTSGMGTLNNSEDSLASHDIYLKIGAPSTDVDTVELMQLVLEEGAGFDATVKLLASMAYGVTGPGESDISIHELVYSLAASLYPGDADNDGDCDFDDFTILLSNYNATGNYAWGDGDFNGSNTVDFDDFTILLSNYNTSAPSASAVPEPSTIVMLILGALCLVGYRTRR